ncbi:hypothetical protein VT84_27650 [Gemmata sp. SH-PL17]|nr:hypothetical protein VT84_27650 [Gemmata sp. SH-PL17]
MICAVLYPGVFEFATLLLVTSRKLDAAWMPVLLDEMAL